MGVDDDLAIDSAVDGARATVSLRGELDLATKAQLVAALTAVVTAGANDVVIDLSGVPFVDSMGLSALLEVRRLGAALTLRNPTERVRRLLDLVMIDCVVSVEPGAGEGSEGNGRKLAGC